MWIICTENVEQDYGENCTTHGIPYILQRDQSLIHRVLWLIVVFFGVSLEKKYVFNYMGSISTSTILEQELREL